MLIFTNLSSNSDPKFHIRLLEFWNHVIISLVFEIPHQTS